MIVGFNQRARDEGVRQGRADGARAVLERLLERRFGTLPQAVGVRLGNATATDLEA